MLKRKPWVCNKEKGLVIEFRAGLVPEYTLHSENNGLILARSRSMMAMGAQRVNSHLT